jgi:phenylalanyl-tRNA synthetase beta subunit
MGEKVRPLWAHEYKTGQVSIGDATVGLVSLVPLATRRAMDEHLSAWGIAWAEIELDPLTRMEAADVRLRRVPEHPEVELDFSMLVDASLPFGEVSCKSIAPGKRSLTYRTWIGAADRTLVDDDLTRFRQAFEKHIASCGFELRA